MVVDTSRVTTRDAIDAYALGRELEASWRLARRKHDGIFYTSEVLATFVAASALEQLGAGDGELAIMDPACGAGAFLLAVDRVLLESCGRARLFGADRQPRAVEGAKRALAARFAREGELATQIVLADSLDVVGLFERLDRAPGTFDLIIGNPPWGAQLTERQRLLACAALGLSPDEERDSWELFVAASLHALRPGGRLALVLPDTLFGPEKANTRKLLVENTIIEKIHNLGPDWFGGHVRMASVFVQARVGAAGPNHCYDAMLLHGELRRRAIGGEVELPFLQRSLSRRIPQARSRSSSNFALEIFRDERDDLLMQRLDEAGEPLATICTRARGEEMAKSGLMWKCTNCQALNNPGIKTKGGGFKSTNCKRCGATLDEATAATLFLVTEERREHAVPFIDGDDLPGRYKAATPSRWLVLDAGAKLKPAKIYAGPKIFVRQAGVGVAATLDDSNARCPQSVYVYRVRPEHEAWTNEYVLAVLLSRTMAYYVFKRFGEVDPARAHAKLTHARLATLPVPRLDLANARHLALRAQIRRDVRALLGGAPLGGDVDWRVELAVRELYGLSAADGEHIDRELQSLPRSQAIVELFPSVPGG